MAWRKTLSTVRELCFSPHRLGLSINRQHRASACLNFASHRFQRAFVGEPSCGNSIAVWSLWDLDITGSTPDERGIA